MSVAQAPVMVDLQTDERWQLVQRIVSSPHFQKSTRLRELLQYLVEQTLHGNAHELTEQHIDTALFHKPSDYSPLEDSSVRVHVRQLRLKLHEYFNEDGRNETTVLEIPKGASAPVFRAVQKLDPAPTAVESKLNPVSFWRQRALLPWFLCGILCVAVAVLGYRGLARRTTSNPLPPAIALSWPFSQIFNVQHQTIIVVADSNYGMARILASQTGSLDQYLRREFLQGPEVSKISATDSRLSEYISNSTLTSFADVADVVSLMRMAGAFQTPVLVRYPRGFCIRDLDHNNYVFIGSPGSNPSVALLQDKLNFSERESVVRKNAQYFMNKNPLT